MMASDGSDEDDLADLDLATFSNESFDLSPSDAGHGNTNENVHQLEEWWDLKDSHIPHHEVLSSDMMHDLQQDEDAFFVLDSNVQTGLPGSEKNQCGKHFNPFLDTNPFQFDSQEPSLSPSFVNPFSEGLFHSDDSLNSFSDENISNKDYMTDFQVDTAFEQTEYVYLNRLPGENLGMVLGIEGDQENRQTIDAVVVKSVTPGGAVARSCQGNNRILVGDEVRQIDGRPLNQLTHDECIAFFQEMPDNVVLTIFRKEKDNEIKNEKTYHPSPSPRTEAKRQAAPIPLPRKLSSRADLHSVQPPEQLAEERHRSNDPKMKISEYEGATRQQSLDDYKVPRGFRKVVLTLFRSDEDNLGLSIVPSYGATCDLYQIKRFLHSGACAKSGLLEIGDRLLECNGQSLKGLTQAQCLNVLKSSGSLVKLTVVRHISDKEYATVTEDPTVLSTSPHIHTEVPFFHSSNTDFVDIAGNVSEHASYSSEQLQESLIDFRGIHETEPQKKYTNNAYESNEYLVQLDDILLLDTDINRAGRKEEQYSPDKIVHVNKDCGPSIHIPSAADYSNADSLKDTEFNENQGDIPVSITNIDDLLFGTVNGTDTVSYNTKTCASVSTNAQNENIEPLLVSFNHKTGENAYVPSLNDTRADYMNTAFIGQPVEKFTEERFSDIGIDFDNNELEKETSYSAGQKSESSNSASEKSLEGTQEELGTSNNSNSLVTFIPVSSDSSAQEYVSKIPLSSVTNSEILKFPETVQPPSTSQIHHSFSRNISVNSQPPVNISHIDVVSSKNVAQEVTLSPVKSKKDASSSVVFHTHGGSSPFAVKSATIKVDKLPPLEAGMNNQLTSPTLHTTVGVTSSCQSGEEEEAVEPMFVVKDHQGTPHCMPSPQLTRGQPAESKTLDGEAKREITEVLSAITSVSSNHTESVSVRNGNDEEVPELEIVPTLLTNNQKEIVSGVLDRWTDVDRSNMATVFQKAVSGVIDNQSRSDQYIVPENALVHTTLGVSNDGHGDDPIQPMIAAKDHQGKQLCIPSPQPERSNIDVRVLDDHAKLEIVNVMSSFSAPQPAVSLSRRDTGQSGYLVAEDEIVPTVLSYDQKQIAQNVLNTWVNDDKSKETSSIHRAVTEFKISHKHENTEGASPCTVESLKTEIGNATADESNPDFKASASTASADIAQASFATATENKPSKILNALNSFDESAEEFLQIPNTNQVTLKPETKQTTNNVTTSEISATESSPSHISDHVVLRNKLNQSTNFTTKIDKFQQPRDPSSSSVVFNAKRPRSMIDTVPVTTSSLKFDDMRKSFTAESKSVPAFRPLSSLRPISASTASVNRHSSASPGRPASGNFSSSTFTARTSRSDYPKTRQMDGSPFQVDVLKGIVGLGIKVQVTPEGHTLITEIQRGGPVDKDGQVRVGDYLLFINSTELTGQTDARVQQILRLLPRGLTKLVVSSAIPASLSDPQQQIFDSNSSNSLSSSQLFVDESCQSTPSLTSQASECASVKDVYSPALPEPVISTANSAINVSLTRVSEQIELPSRSRKGSDSVLTFEKPAPATTSEHIIHPKAMPRHGLAYSLSASSHASSENTNARESQDSGGPSAVATEIASCQIKALEEVAFVPKHQSAFNSEREMFDQKTEVEHTEAAPPLSLTHPVPLLEDTSTTFTNNQIASPASPTLSPPLSPASKDIKNSDVRTEQQEKEEKLESVKTPPHKVPPPVAPKPRLSSASWIKSEERVDSGEPKIPPPRITAGYERLQADTKVPRLSTSGDKSNSFVSSTAKMFDNKTVSSEAASDQPFTKRLSRSVVMHADSSKVINNSLLPVQDRLRSPQVSQPVSSQPVTFSSSSLPRPRTLSYTEAMPKEIATPESSFKTSESADEKAKSVLSPTHLNSALSPRKTSSSDSPTSPPHNMPTKHVSTVKEESSSKFVSGKSQTIHQYGIYKSTPLALLTGKSPPHKVLSSRHPDQSSHVVTTEPHSTSFTSPVLSPSLGKKVEVLQDTMKKFDDLLMDAPYTPSETDFHDLLLWPSAGSLTSSQIADSAHLQTADIKKPVALPRKKPEPKESEVRVNAEVYQVKDNEELNSMKMKEKRVELVVEVSNLVSPADEINTFSGHVDNQENDNIVPSVIPELIQKSHNISAENVPKEIAETFVTSDEAGREIKHSSEQFEVPNKLLEFDHSNVANASANHPEPVQNFYRMINENGLEHLQRVPSDVANQQKNENIDDEDISEQFYHYSYASVIDDEVKNNEKLEEDSEANEKHMEILKAQAYQIVEAVVAKVQNSLDIFHQDQKADITSEPAAESFEAQDQKADITSEPASAESLEGEPPPLPGAPPPPLIFRDTSLLVSAHNLVDQKWSPVVAEHNSKYLVEKDKSEDTSRLIQFDGPSAIQQEVNTYAESLIMVSQPDVTEKNNKSKTDSVEPLNSSGGGLHYCADMGVNSPSLMDLLSEDSGMPDSELLPTSTIAQDFDSSEIYLGYNANSSVDEDPLLRDATLNITSKGVSEDTPDDNLPSPLLPTSACSAAGHVSATYTEDFLVQTSLPFVQPSILTSLPPEVNLLGGDVSADKNKELAQEVESSRTGSEFRLELTEESSPFENIDIANITLVSHPDASIEDQVLLPATDIPCVMVTSKRKWCLISSKFKAPVLSGDSHVPVKADYTDKTLVSSLPQEHLKSVVSKANELLDAVSAPENLAVFVLHFHQDEESISLGLDLNHEGGILFQVSGVTKDSSLWKEGGVENGDWLLSVDGLWCDQVNLTSFESRLANLKSDLLLVFARGDNPVNVTETASAKPVPSPRSRSAQKQQTDEQILKMSQDGDFVDARSELSPVQESIQSLTEDKPVANVRQHKLTTSQQGTEAQFYLSEEKFPALEASLPQQDKANIILDHIPSIPDQEPPLLDHAPPLLDQALPLQEQAALLQEQLQLHSKQSDLDHLQTPSVQESPIPAQGPSLLDQAPPLPNQAPPLPNQAPPIPDQAPPPLPDQAPPLPDKTPPLPRKAPSLLEQTHLHPYQTPSLLDQALSLPIQVSSLSGEVSVNGVPQLHQEDSQTSLKKASQPVHEGSTIPAKSDPASNGDLRKTAVKLEMKGAELTSSDVPVKSLSAKSAQEHLSAEHNRSTVNSSDELGPGFHKVVMIKGATGVGFCLEGGICSPKGNMPITIKRIFKGGPAEKCGKLKVKDEILEVNGVKFDSMRHYEAWNHLKFLDDGEVHITIHRP